MLEWSTILLEEQWSEARSQRWDQEGVLILYDQFWGDVAWWDWQPSSPTEVETSFVSVNIWQWGYIEHLCLLSLASTAVTRSNVGHNLSPWEDESIHGFSGLCSFSWAEYWYFCDQRCGEEAYLRSLPSLQKIWATMTCSRMSLLWISAVQWNLLKNTISLITSEGYTPKKLSGV